MVLQPLLQEPVREHQLRYKNCAKGEMVPLSPNSIALLSRPLVAMETGALRRGKWRKVAAGFLPIPTSALFAQLWLQ